MQHPSFVSHAAAGVFGFPFVHLCGFGGYHCKNPVKTDNKSDNHGKKEKKEKKNSYRATLFHRVGVAVDVAELVAWRKEEKEEEGREALW